MAAPQTIVLKLSDSDEAGSAGDGAGGRMTCWTTDETRKASGSRSGRAGPCSQDGCIEHLAQVPARFRAHPGRACGGVASLCPGGNRILNRPLLAQATTGVKAGGRRLELNLFSHGVLQTAWNPSVAIFSRMSGSARDLDDL
jgi:hypothetical protein